MKKYYLLMFLSLFIISFISSSPTGTTNTSTTIDYKGYTITPTLDPKTTLDDKIYSLVLDKNSFYIQTKDAKPFTLTNYYIKTDFNPDENFDCKTTYQNQFGSCSVCSKYDDSKFLSKNNIKSREVMVIDDKGLWWTIENWFKEILGIKPTPAYSYIINYTGTINDTDPSFFETITTSSSGFFNRTEVSSVGVRSSASLLFMDFNSPPEAPLGTPYNNSIGTYIKDGSVYNNFGTTTGTLDNSWWEAGNFSNALRFDGSDDRVSIGTMGNINDSNVSNWAISAWFKKEGSSSSTWQDIFSLANTASGAGHGIHLTMVSGKVGLGYRNYAGVDSTVLTGATYNDSKWHMATIQRDIAGNLSIYIDGIYRGYSIVGMQTAGGLTQTSLGCAYSGAIRFAYNGVIDETMFFNRTLSGAEISNLYLNQSANINDVLINDISLMAYWRLNETDGSRAKDEKSIRNGSLSGFTTTTPIYNATGGYDGSGAYSFDGVNDVMTIPLTASIKGKSQATISAWIKSNQVTNTGTQVIYSEAINAGGASRFNLNMNTSGSIGMIYRDSLMESAGTTVSIYSPTPITANVWTHAVVIYDSISNLSSIYVNGILVKSQSNVTTSFATSNSAGIAIGDLYNSVVNYFNGSIDQVIVLPYALTASEVVCLYNGTGCNGVNNSDYLSKYAPATSKTDYTSFIFYNSTSSFWNLTFSTADTNSPRSGVVNADNSINLSNPNLVSYWAFDRNFVDATGLNNGTAVNGVNNATGLVSPAMRFDGVDDYVNLGNDSSSKLIFNSSGNFSITAWIKTNNNAATNALYCDSWNQNIGGSVGTSALLFYVASGGILKFYTSGPTGATNAAVTGSRQVADNQWHLATIVYINRNATLYVDGIYDNSTILTLTPSNIYLTNQSYGRLIGTSFNTSSNSYTNPFKGNIDEVLIYNKSLSVSEISQLYKLGLSQKANTNITLQYRIGTSYNISDPSLVALWGFNDDNSSTAFDELGINNGARQGGILNATELNGTVGKGYYFDGLDGADSINISNITAKNWTFSAWVKYNTFAGGGYRRIFGQAGNQFDIATTDQANGNLGFYDGTWRTTSYYLTLNKLEHIVFTYNGTSMRGYANGKLIYSSGSTGRGLGGALYIGSCYTFAGTCSMSGTIDEVRIYNRSLSASEIQDLYNLGTTHINWNNAGNYSTESLVNDGIGQVSQTGGKFMQFRANLNTNDTSASPYVLSYNISNPYEGSYPTINFTSPTTSAGTQAEGQTYIYANVTSSGISINITLYNQTRLVNSFYCYSNKCEYNFTSLPFTTYYLNASTTGSNGLTNQTETRTINLVADSTNPFANLSIYGLPAFNWVELAWNIIDVNIGSAINLSIWNNNILFRIANSPTSPYLMNGLHDSTNYTAIIWINDTYGNINYTTLNFTTKYAYNDTRFDYNETSPIYVPQSCPANYTQTGILSNGTIVCSYLNITSGSSSSGKTKICINKPTSQYDDCSIYGTCKYCYYV